MKQADIKEQFVEIINIEEQKVVGFLQLPLKAQKSLAHFDGLHIAYKENV